MVCWGAQEGPLLKLRARMLFVCSAQHPLCPPAALAELQPRLQCPSSVLVVQAGSSFT